MSSLPAVFYVACCPNDPSRPGSLCLWGVPTPDALDAVREAAKHAETHEEHPAEVLRLDPRGPVQRIAVWAGDSDYAMDERGLANGGRP